MAPKNESWDPEHEKIRKVQACVRGTLVRRKLQQLRQKYEVLVRELGDPAFNVDITWTSRLPCVPTVLPKDKSSRIQVKPTADKQVVKTSVQGDERLSKKDASTETVFPQNSGEDLRGKTKIVEMENTEHFQAGETVRRTTTNIDGVMLDELKTCSSNQELSQVGLHDGSEPLLPPQCENQDNQIRRNSSEPDTDTDAGRKNPSPVRMEEVHNKGSSRVLNFGTEGRHGWTSEQYTPSQRIHDSSTEHGNSWARSAEGGSIDLLPTTDNSSKAGPTDPHVEQVSLAEETSLWELEDSFPGVPEKPVYPKDPAELGKVRSHVSMELLWVQQAITSRKNYLRMKQNLEQ